MHRSSWPEDLSDELAAQHPRSIFWHPQVGDGSNLGVVTVAANIQRRDRLGGLVHEYYQVAA